VVSTDYPPILDQLDLGAPVSLVSVGGGCIADARIATFENGTRVFVKCASGANDMFECEALGLAALAQANAIRVPRVLAVEKDGLVLECIQPAPRKRDFADSFGRNLARLHRHRGKTSGFEQDNYIGSTRQRNDPVGISWEDAPEDDGSGWPEFFLQRRLRFQVGLAAENGYGDELQRLLDGGETRIVDLLSASIEPPVILHGDLWGGNYIVDDRGEACLIDPAVYFGHREAELAMTRLFGGFETSFYRAYEDAAPLADGHEERLPIYQLYHVLNHLNLFGGAYLGQSRRILQYYSSNL
jgi:fructosamine-3-kinase